MLYELPEIAGQDDESLADDRRSIPLNFFCLFLRRSINGLGFDLELPRAMSAKSRKRL